MRHTNRVVKHQMAQFQMHHCHIYSTSTYISTLATSSYRESYGVCSLYSTKCLQRDGEQILKWCSGMQAYIYFFNLES